jgi:ubiquitin carboxyl-terminal hydrolase 8
MWCLIKLDLDLTTVADAMSSITRNCPRCKVPRRASKTLTIARLPPVLLIQLKRFTTQNGVFWDKSETPVIFPVNGLDMSRYVPRRQPTGKEDLDDPRTQVAPFKYDLYGVSNHMGTLSSGHCE